MEIISCWKRNADQLVSGNWIETAASSNGVITDSTESIYGFNIFMFQNFASCRNKMYQFSNAMECVLSRTYVYTETSAQDLLGYEDIFSLHVLVIYRGVYHLSHNTCRVLSGMLSVEQILRQVFSGIPLQVIWLVIPLASYPVCLISCLTEHPTLCLSLVGSAR